MMMMIIIIIIIPRDKRQLDDGNVTHIVSELKATTNRHWSEGIIGG